MCSLEQKKNNSTCMNHIEKCTLSVNINSLGAISLAERYHSHGDMICLYMVIPLLSGQVYWHFTTDCNNAFACSIGRLNEQIVCPHTRRLIKI